MQTNVKFAMSLSRQILSNNRE